MNTPRHLYRYRPVNEFTLQEIAWDSVYLCPLTKLNDDQEGYFSKVPSNTQELRDLLVKHALADGELEIAQMIDTIPSRTMRQLETYMLETGAEYVDARKRWGVVCFTERLDNGHMWRRYAGDHTGVVIEYDFGAVTIPDGALLKVIYAEKRGELRLSNVLNPAQTGRFSEILAVKAPLWSAEEEWRLLSNEVGPAILNIPIRRVIAGLATSNVDKTRVVQALLTHRHARFAEMIRTATGEIVVHDLAASLPSQADKNRRTVGSDGRH